ncbi:hypothetical protein [Alloprevotella tannerae]|uniref:hypothetical protein n=1 Tax=Alloprevotella tannerae TaxID=76122 RepID=UPI0028E36FDD|nr:hypothetical protein [Alloprevotella tannerae]
MPPFLLHRGCFGGSSAALFCCSCPLFCCLSPVFFRLPAANDGLVGAYYGLVAANHCLVGANETKSRPAAVTLAAFSLKISYEK